MLPELQTEAARLALIPVTERCIEARHADAMKAISRRHSGPLSVSMAIRLREIEKHVHRDMNYSKLLCEQVSNTKHIHKIPKLLGLQSHPWITGLPPKCQRSFLVSVLTRVIYRCDLPSQFEDYSSVRAFNDLSWQRKRPRPIPPRPIAAGPAAGFAFLQLFWVTEHVRALRSAEFVYSMPLCEDFLPHLQDLSERLAPRSGHQPQDEDMCCDVEMGSHCNPLVGPGLPGHNEGKRVYFRFVHMNPKAQKLPSITADKLRPQDIAVQVLCVQDASSQFVDVGHFHRQRIALLSYMESDAGWLRDHLWVHSLSPQLRYVVGSAQMAPDAGAESLSESAMLERVFSSGAFVGHSAQCWIPRTDSLYAQAQRLCEVGILQAEPGIPGFCLF